MANQQKFEWCSLCGSGPHTAAYIRAFTSNTLKKYLRKAYTPEIVIIDLLEIQMFGVGEPFAVCKSHLLDWILPNFKAHPLECAKCRRVYQRKYGKTQDSCLTGKIFVDVGQLTVCVAKSTSADPEIVLRQVFQTTKISDAPIFLCQQDFDDLTNACIRESRLKKEADQSGVPAKTESISTGCESESLSTDNGTATPQQKFEGLCMLCDGNMEQAVHVYPNHSDVVLSLPLHLNDCSRDMLLKFLHEKFGADQSLSFCSHHFFTLQRDLENILHEDESIANCRSSQQASVKEFAATSVNPTIDTHQAGATFDELMR